MEKYKVSFHAIVEQSGHAHIEANSAEEAIQKYKDGDFTTLVIDDETQVDEEPPTAVLASAAASDTDSDTDSDDDEDFD